VRKALAYTTSSCSEEPPTASEILTELGASSKLNAEWEFFSLLRDEGRRSAQVFLESHASNLGRRSTLDLDVLLEQI